MWLSCVDATSVCVRWTFDRPQVRRQALAIDGELEPAATVSEPETASVAEVAQPALHCYISYITFVAAVVANHKIATTYTFAIAF